MNKSKSTIIIFFIILLCISHSLGIWVGKRQESRNHVTTISVEEYNQYVNDKTSFILVVERPSCRYCAIVTSAVYQINDCELPIYLMDLEPYWETEEYDRIKNELQVSYLPSFKYVKNGNIVYNMNSPLDTGYYESSGKQRRKMYHEMEDKIHKFLAGATGKGPVVNEELLQDVTVQGISELKETE